MEYFALILFIIGVILLLVGLFLPGSIKKRSTLAESYHNDTIKKNDYSATEVKNELNTENETNSPYPFVSMPKPEPQVENLTQTEKKSESDYGIKVHVSEKSPSLFEKSGYLYLDYSSQNTYTGRETTFNLHLLKDVHRTGKGVLQYTGSNFEFISEKGNQKFAINQIDHIAFYPNCFVIVQKNSLPSALIFLDETKSLRNVLETFRIENAPN